MQCTSRAILKPGSGVSIGLVNVVILA
jgi:hypothetical protein